MDVTFDSIQDRQSRIKRMLDPVQIDIKPVRAPGRNRNDRYPQRLTRIHT